MATVLFIPGSVLTLGAGFVFAAAFGLGGGLVLGTAAVFVGASLGACMSFLLARYLLRDQVAKLTHKYAIFQALDSALEANGFRIFLLLRLSPIVPFNILNYIAGVTAISFRDYMLALFGLLPGTILYVFLGASAGSLADSSESDQDPLITIIIVVVGVVFGIFAIYMTTRYARAELAKITAQGEEESVDDNVSEEDDSRSDGGGVEKIAEEMTS